MNLFSYGSNMLARRILERVESARVISTGYVVGRLIAFHKRSGDGSAKADAMFTGRESDRIWGVVHSLSIKDKRVLDKIEYGYDSESVSVICTQDSVLASIYVASRESIDATLKPYCWYHRYVVDGAIENGFPPKYVDDLKSIPCVTDPDEARRIRNSLIA